MIFSITDPIEFKKFAELHDKLRYCCYKIKIHGLYVLRPIKTSRNLDTAIYNGIDSKDLTTFLTETFNVITVKEITLIQE